jgi:hypothetical protein
MSGKAHCIPGSVWEYNQIKYIVDDKSGIVIPECNHLYNSIALKWMTEDHIPIIGITNDKLPNNLSYYMCFPDLRNFNPNQGISSKIYPDHIKYYSNGPQGFIDHVKNIMGNLKQNLRLETINNPCPQNDTPELQLKAQKQLLEQQQYVEAQATKPDTYIPKLFHQQLPERLALDKRYTESWNKYTILDREFYNLVKTVKEIENEPVTLAKALADAQQLVQSRAEFVKQRAAVAADADVKAKAAATVLQDTTLSGAAQYQYHLAFNMESDRKNAALKDIADSNKELKAAEAAIIAAGDAKNHRERLESAKAALQTVTQDRAKAQAEMDAILSRSKELDAAQVAERKSFEDAKVTAIAKIIAANKKPGTPESQSSINTIYDMLSRYTSSIKTSPITTNPITIVNSITCSDGFTFNQLTNKCEPNLTSSTLIQPSQNSGSSTLIQSGQNSGSSTLIQSGANVNTTMNSITCNDGFTYNQKTGNCEENTVIQKSNDVPVIQQQNSDNTTTIVIVIGVVLVGAIGTGAYFFMAKPPIPGLAGQTKNRGGRFDIGE